MMEGQTAGAENTATPVAVLSMVVAKSSLAALAALTCCSGACVADRISEIAKLDDVALG